MHPSLASCAFALIVATTLVGVSGIARADCVDGVRQTTPAELEFAARGEAALAAAMPAPIANSERLGNGYNFSQPPRLSFCKGDRTGAFSPGVRFAYLYKFPQAEADRMYTERKAVEQQIETLKSLPPEKEARYNELIAQMRAAYASAPRRQRKDPPFTPKQQAQADRADAEGRKLEAEANKYVADHVDSVRPQTERLKKQADALQGYPQEIFIHMGMNMDKFPEAGPTLATFGKANPQRSEGLRVHNVVVIAEGPDGAARQAFLDAVDKTYLQGLIGQPLPEVAVSKARAERGAADRPMPTP